MLICPDILSILLLFRIFSVDLDEVGSSELNLQTATVSISQHGEMGWLKKLVTTSTCKMDFYKFPFDKQVCSLELVSWSYDNSSIFLVPIPVNDVVHQDDNWNITKIETSVVYKDADCCKHPFSYIIIKVYITRNAAPLTLGLVIPSSLLSILVLISFVLPADSGERISLCITLLLTVTLFQQLTSEMIPRSQIPKLSMYLFVLLVILMLALIANAFVINIHFRGTRKMSSITMKILLGALGYLFCFRRDKDDISKEKNELDLIHNLVFELNENMDRVSNPIYEPPEFYKSQNRSTTDVKVRNINTENKTDVEFPERNYLTTEKCKTCNEKDKLQSNWIDACIILDRLFLTLFTIIFIVTIIWVALS